MEIKTGEKYTGTGMARKAAELAKKRKAANKRRTSEAMKAARAARGKK